MDRVLRASHRNRSRRGIVELYVDTDIRWADREGTVNFYQVVGLIHESAACAGYERFAKDYEGCGKGMFVIKIALHVSTVVCRTCRRCCGTFGEHLGWVHESVLVCARLPRATAWVDLRSSACALWHSCKMHFRPTPTLFTGGCGHRVL